ncbi:MULTISPECIES: fimbrial protein [unclassified Vibrio]|uniref:fimbrial protein n=1 Tax=unclassified Vibrio TaxID=2614977 RepID=UPI001361DD07|nr:MULTISPECIES: fimbrial protein [unclassified Vibrio]NAW60122.1 fimbrial protein [Vibrio sp. V36_P2S2PM302]NAX28044.1 fimbrial protein [Vibrio sp. V38_P2S17PM301]
MNIFVRILVSVFVLIALSPAAYATCKITQGPIELPEMTLSTTVSAGNDLPVGGELFSVVGGVYVDKAARVECTTTGQFYSGFKVSNIRYGIASVQPGTNENQLVYNTMLPGVGIHTAKNKTWADCSSTTICYWPQVGLMRVAGYRFVKTGPITPGVIDLSTIPISRHTTGQVGAMVEYGGVRLKGTLRVTVPTCVIQPADKKVNLGTFDINSDFSGTDNATAWVNTGGIVLNCPAVSGRQVSTIEWNDRDGYTKVPARTANTYTIAFSRTSNTIADAARGIIAIDSASAGTASGVGIQLSSKPGTAGIINLDSAHVANLPLNSAKTVTFPLYARYIKTGNKITAGRADGRLTFTVSYK